MVNYYWSLENATFTKNLGNVFSCFACGGGSTMGYKLSGFDVIGCNEIDPKMNEVYVENHKPKINYLCDIRELLNIKLNEELYNLTIFDGSPPCSSFSLAGNRSKDWGKLKKFKEGQKEQVLDTLFFDTIQLIKKLKPKISILENVEGIMFADAINYVKKIYHDFDEAGYYLQHHLLDSSEMGVPQRKSRVFFIAIRKDLRNLIPNRDISLFNKSPYLNLNFKEKEIIFNEIEEFDFNRGKLSEKEIKMWENADELGYHYVNGNHGRRLFGFFYKMMRNRVSRTIIGSGCYALEKYPEKINRNEIVKISSFPIDYNFLNQNPYTICGMSVPQIMMYKLVERIKEQWLGYIQ